MSKNTAIAITEKEALVATVEKQGLTELIKPLTKEIHLFDTFIAGTTHLQEPEVLDAVKVGDKLTLLREVNKFDDNAILVLNTDGKKLGYVPEMDNLVFARLMDAGKMLIAKVRDISMKGSFKKISIEIYLVDF